MTELPNGAVVRWSGEDSWFVASDPYEHAISIDEPEPIGRNHGPRPTDLLLAAAASCSGISAVALFKKMRQPVGTLTVRASGERQPDWPKAYTSIRLDFEVGVTAEPNRELIEKAVRLAVTKYCPVSATIEMGDGAAHIDFFVTINTTGGA
ncbi:MAG TPA: OsmC family protein [Chloroflexota bacterium]|jgi:putative redox protein|nr:OsmC family protein [Chloroflexota bacterium]